MATLANQSPDPSTDKPPRPRRWIPLSLRMFMVIVVLVHLQALTGLHWLSLDRTFVTDAGLEHLQGTQITDRGMADLAKILSLRDLNVSRTNISDVGLDELTKLKDLKRLELSIAKFSEAGLEKFERALPDVTVIHAHPMFK